MGIHIILYDTLSVFLNHTEIEQGISKTLFGSKFAPLHRSFIDKHMQAAKLLKPAN